MYRHASDRLFFCVPSVLLSTDGRLHSRFFTLLSLRKKLADSASKALPSILKAEMPEKGEPSPSVQDAQAPSTFKLRPPWRFPKFRPLNKLAQQWLDFPQKLYSAGGDKVDAVLYFWHRIDLRDAYTRSDVLDYIEAEEDEQFIRTAHEFFTSRKRGEFTHQVLGKTADAFFSCCLRMRRIAIADFTCVDGNDFGFSSAGAQGILVPDFFGFFLDVP